MKKYLILLLVLFLVVSTSFVGVSNKEVFIDTDTTKMSDNGCLQNSPWPMYGHDAQNTCRSEYDASQNEGYEKWKYFVDSALNLVTPVIDGNGTLYITSSSKGLHAIYPNGTRKWHRDLVGFTEFQPVIGLDGTIYAGTTQGFHAFYPNGTLRWTLPIGGDVCGKPVISPDGIIYVGTSSGYLYAVNPNGTVEWDYNLGYRFIGTSLDAEGNIYFTARSCDYLYSLNPNGTFRWRFEIVMNTADAPLIGDDGTIYTVPIYDVIAINPDGTEKWRVPCEHGMSPALSPDGTIVYSSHDSGKVMGIDPDDGHVLWTYEVGLNPSHKTRAVVSGDGFIFFAYTDELGDTAYLTALNPDGTIGWTADITSDFYPYDGMSVDNPPSISADGTVYVTTWYYGDSPIYHDFGYVHAFGLLDPNAPTAPTITGPIKGKVGVQQEYTFTSTSPTGSDLYYYVLWGDGTYVDWTGPFPSGEPVSLNHTWSERGTYTIQARARDSNNLCGPWDTMKITMPFSYESQFPFIHWLLERFPNAFPILRYLIGFS